MNEDVKQQLYGVILEFCRGKTAEDIDKAQNFADLELDSIALMSILDEVEDTLGIRIEPTPSMTITVPEFRELVQGLVDQKNA